MHFSCCGTLVLYSEWEQEVLIFVGIQILTSTAANLLRVVRLLDA